MKEYKLAARIPVILLGVPLSTSENPFLAVPTRKASASFKFEKCNPTSISVNGVPEIVGNLVKSFVKNLDEISKDICVEVDARLNGSNSPAGTYALLTTLLMYAIAKYYGESLDSWEIIELARYADPFDKPNGWSYVIDALRYSVITGTPAVYRNDEEFAKIEVKRTIDTVFKGVVEAKSQFLLRENLGGDVYNALVHLVGVLVLEGTVRIRENESFAAIIDTLGRLQNSIVTSTWRIEYPPPNCLLEPGLPGEFEIHCW